MRESGGRVFFPEDAGDLPDVIAREAARATGGWDVRKRVIPRGRVPHPILNGFAATDFPALDGYVAAAARPGAEVILGVDSGEPVLSAWRFGLGRVAVFNADLSAAFVDWRGFGALWRQAVRWLGRGRDADRTRVELVERAGGFRLAVDAATAAGDFANGLNGRATLRGPDNHEHTVNLRQTEPGRYEGDLPFGQPGAYLVDISLANARGQEEIHRLTGLFRSSSGDRRDEAADLPRLTRIAEAGGGAMLGETDNPFAEPRPAAYHDASGILALLALISYLVELAWRQGLTPAVLRGLWQTRFGRSGVAA